MNTPFRMHRSRVETLVDGIFAIAMTILVLEVKVPDLVDRRSTEELMLALAHHGSVIAAYFFSFAMLALFWVWHHRLAEKIREFDLPLLVCTVTFLALVCSFPFAAALLGRYPTNLAALMVYVPLTGAIIFVLTAFLKLAMHRGLIAVGVEMEAAIAAHRRNLRGCAVFCIASVPTALRIDLWPAIVCVAFGSWFLWRAKRN